MDKFKHLHELDVGEERHLKSISGNVKKMVALKE